MKKIYLLLALILTSCAPATVTVNGEHVDPFLAIAQAERTAQAAQDQADFYSRQLTATAEAPIIAITSTAAAFEMQMMYSQATSQSAQMTETAAITQTAAAWTPTVVPNATTNLTATMAVLELSATAQIMANDVVKDNLSVERAKSTNIIYALTPYIVGLLAVLVAVMFGIAMARKLAVNPNPVDDRGNPLPMFDVVEGTAWDIDRSANGMISTRQSFSKQLPQISAERQDAVTTHDQMVDLRTRSVVWKRVASSLPKQLPEPAVVQPIEEDDLNLPLPPWEFITRWDIREPLPLGFGRKGLITAKAASPHILIAGKTGSRKTRGMLRPLTVASLAKGHLVFNIGYSEAGFGVFTAHPNYHKVKITDPREVLECLSQVYDEHKSRKSEIGDRDIEWEHWNGEKPPRPFVMLLVDELEMLSEDLYQGYSNGADLCNELWSLTARIVKEGRKTGINFTGALQDGTGKSIDLRFRRNCTLVTFQLGDPSHSNAFIGTRGADKLTEGHFMARTDGLVVGGAFMPTDAEITDYLSKLPLKALEKPKWIDGVISPSRRIEPGEEARRLPEVEVKPLDEIAQMAESIRGQWMPMMSKRAAAKLLGYSQYGGAYADKVDRVLDYLGATTTTPKNSPENGSFEPVVA